MSANIWQPLLSLKQHVITTAQQEHHPPLPWGKTGVFAPLVFIDAV